MKISRKLILAIAALGLVAGPASSLEARSRKQNDKKSVSAKTSKERRRNNNNNDGRGGRAAGFIGGATVAGVAVGATKGAGWGVLGAAGGGIAGYFLVRAIQKGRKNRRDRKDREHKNKEMKTDRSR